MQVKNKWKSFAMGHVMSSWTDTLVAYEVYNAIHDAEYDELSDVFKQHDICVWGVFEDWDLGEVREQLCGLAEDAQYHDNLETDNA